MPLYRFDGFDEAGGRVSSSVDAADSAEAMRLLRERRILVSSIAEMRPETDWRETLGLPSDSIGLSDLEFLTAELSLLLDSGVRIDRALGILQRSGKSSAVSRLLSQLTDELKQGRQLSHAMEAHPAVFGKLYVHLV